MFCEPHWLVLLIFVFWFCFAFRPANRRLLYLHVSAAVLLIFALSGLQLPLPSKEGAVIVVADRSLSMPKGSLSQINETINLLEASKPDKNKLGVISFGETANIDKPLDGYKFSGFSSIINSEGSNLASALAKALQMAPQDMPARILVLSDGMYTGKSLKKAAFEAAGRGIPIDYRFLSGSFSQDTAIAAFDVPNLLDAKEAFIISASIYSPYEQNCKIELICNNNSEAVFNARLKHGFNSLSFSCTAPRASAAVYRLRVVPPDNQDAIPENNEAKAIAQIREIKPILLISDQPNTQFEAILKKCGKKFEIHKSSDFLWSLEKLAGYSAVIIENVSANQLGLHFMQVLRAYVQYAGGGLMLTGGNNSFGAGGYYKSPLESILPVALEMRSEKRKMPLALVIALDRSGSMSQQIQGGRRKIDLANMAAAGCVDMLMPLDEFSLLAVDTKVHEVVPLRPVINTDDMHKKILRVESAGGGIFVEEALKYACNVLIKSKVKNRHIILFADANDAEQPGTYWVLLDKAVKAGITCSVVGLGRETDNDANILKNVAKAGKGRIFFTNNPLDLPRLFAQDTFMAAKMAYVEEPTKIKIEKSLAEIVKEPKITTSQISAYNVCYQKAGAITPIYTLDENETPILAAWQRGLGRVACYTGLVASERGEEFLTTGEGAEILAGLAAYITADDRQTVDDMIAEQKIVRGEWQANLYLDAEDEAKMLLNAPTITVLKSSPNTKPTAHRLKMKWKTADCLTASLPLNQNETVVASVQTNKNAVLTLPPICQMYSQEFAPFKLESGKKTLAEIAEITGGSEIFDVAQIFKTMPSKKQFRRLTELIYAVILLVLIEIIERRTSFVSYMFGRLFSRTAKQSSVVHKQAGSPTPAEVKKPITKHKYEGQSRLSEAEAKAKTEAKSEPAANEQPDSSVFSALRQAKKRAAEKNRSD